MYSGKMWCTEEVSLNKKLVITFVSQTYWYVY